jgi:hypothetical protein
MVEQKQIMDLNRVPECSGINIVKLLNQCGTLNLSSEYVVIDERWMVLHCSFIAYCNKLSKDIVRMEMD